MINFFETARQKVTLHYTIVTIKQQYLTDRMLMDRAYLELSTPNKRR
jgi:hypothetical protein